MSDELSMRPLMRMHLPSPDEIRHSALLITRLQKELDDKRARILVIEDEENSKMEEYQEKLQQRQQKMQQHRHRMKIARQEIEDEYKRAQDKHSSAVTAVRNLNLDRQQTRLHIARSGIEDEFSKAQKVYRSSLATINSAYNLERKKYLTKRKKERDQRNAEISLLRVQLPEIEKKIELEHAFISPIRKLPAELFSEIFTICILGQAVTRYTLARVCRSWKQIVLSTPRLWSKISPHLWGGRPLEQLQTRLALSRHAPLDISFQRFPLYISKEAEANVHKELAKHGVERWRSLTIYPNGNDRSCEHLLGIYTGRFTSLQDLIIKGLINSTQLPFVSDILGLVANSRVPLQTLEVTRMKELPYFTKDTHLGSLSALTCNFDFFQTISVPSDITSINLSGMNKIERTFENVAVATLSRCVLECISSFPNVTQLTLEDIEELPTKPLYVPQLRVLDIMSRTPSILGAISAPRLERLFVAQEHDDDVPMVTLKTMELFKGELNVAPTMLRFCFDVSIAALRSVCASWPQIEHGEFHLCIGKGHQGESTFVTALTRKSSKSKALELLPRLASLKLRIQYMHGRRKTSEEEIQTWKIYSKKLLACRPSLEFVKCSWIDRNISYTYRR